MDKRWVLTDVDGNILRTLDPVGAPGFTYQRDASIALVAMRVQLAGSIMFIGEDYKYFKAIERRAGRRCEDLYIRHDWFCDARWETVWNGIFTVGSGTWDLERCQFTVRPDTNDAYTCILKNMDAKVNILQIAPTTLQYQSASEFDFVFSDQNFDGVDGYTLEVTTVDGFGCTLYLNWREKTRTYCSGGSPQAPSTAGWSLLTNNCATLGYADYVRNATIAYTYGTPTAGTWVDYANNIALPPDDSCNWKRVDFQGAGCVASETESLPYYICFDPPVIVADEESIPRARSFGDCAELLLSSSGCNLTLSSDFFEINPTEDAPGYVSGDNYVTGEANQLSNMYFYQLSDVLRLTSNPATVGEMTLKQLFQLLAAWRCWWFIDDAGAVRFEHYTYFLNRPIQSLLSYDRTESRTYSYLKSETPRAERLTWLRELFDDVDFKGSDIIYDSACAANVDPAITAIQNVITDIDFVRGPNNSDIPKQGFLLVACDGSNKIILDLGAISNTVVPNAPLSTANLFDKYWTWDRLLPSGTMNGEARDFDGFVPNVEQQVLSVKGCCDVLDFDLRDRFETSLGNELGDYAYIVKADLDGVTGLLTMKARYKRGTV